MSISGNSFVINAEDFSKQTIGLPWFSLEFGSDQLPLLKACQLSPQAVRLEGVVPLSFLVQPADDPAWVVLDLEFLTGPDPLVPIQNPASGVNSTATWTPRWVMSCLSFSNSSGGRS